MNALRPLLGISLLGLAVTSPLRAQADDPPGRRQIVPMDSTRAARLYVSNRPEDHPLADYDRAIKSKAAADSIFAARAKGVVKFSKVTYKSQAGGMDIPAYLFEPLTPKGTKQHAAMVWVHGGVHGNMDQNYWPFIREAVQRGYAIITPDYRGSTGYGAAHHNAIDYGGMEVDDVESAAEVLKALPYVNPERLGVMGWSHGGYITALLLTREATGSPFKSGAAIVPVTNLLFRLSFKGPSYQRSFSTMATVRGLPFEKREEYIRPLPVLLGGQPQDAAARARGDERRRCELRRSATAHRRAHRAQACARRNEDLRESDAWARQCGAHVQPPCEPPDARAR
ncbi:alpha/beta hydrolase family protein [Gemmatimonas sp.]|uniref:alpha/beta hydrolase family protein n=1 Tax=Gemmatimonas sp. TaxID=1962908 RepID=UPI003DA4FA0A